MINKFDVVVVGAGHAGLEAAFIASKLSMKVALFNMNLHSVANLPCNPSIGGPAKGVVTREIDALGGMQAIAADFSKIQIKKVNHSKGPGVWAYRAQIDKNLYHKFFLQKIEENPNITLILDEVISLIVEDGKIVGIKTKTLSYECKCVIVTAGTYLKSELYREKKFADSGPDSNPPSNYLSDSLRELNIDLVRFKTGTSPRVYTNSIDFSVLERDDSNDGNISFSFRQPKKLPIENQMYCYLTETTIKTRELIMKNLDELGTYNGSIVGRGPRYCPSIEDKYVKFPDREKHYIFVEPVARDCDFCYISGLSTSLNKNLQEDLIRTLKGFENAKICKYAYSIVYDAINPINLKKTLEHRQISGLYFAGQMNGTSGYEEAAAQGLIAGINSALRIIKKPPFILKRNESYIGVMIDDLTAKGTNEPYRLLTSRAEYRLLLRNDNADERLMPLAYELGTLSEDEFQKFKSNKYKMDKNILFLKNNYAAKFGLISGSEGPLTLFSWLSRKSSTYEDILEVARNCLEVLDDEWIEKLMIKVKYEGYIKNQESRINKLDKWKQISLINIENYQQIPNLSKEAVEKLNFQKPITMNDAMQISGINLNDIFWIKAFLDRKCSSYR